MFDQEQQSGSAVCVGCWPAPQCLPRLAGRAGVATGQGGRARRGSYQASWLESGVYGYRKITRALPEVGESCGKHRTARLMRQEGLCSQVGYRRRPGMGGGRPAIVDNNQLAHQFDPGIANQVWVTDIKPC